MNNETKSLVFCGAVSALVRMFGIVFGSEIIYLLNPSNN